MRKSELVSEVGLWRAAYIEKFWQLAESQERVKELETEITELRQEDGDSWRLRGLKSWDAPTVTIEWAPCDISYGGTD